MYHLGMNRDLSGVTDYISTVEGGRTLPIRLIEVANENTQAENKPTGTTLGAISSKKPVAVLPKTSHGKSSSSHKHDEHDVNDRVHGLEKENLQLKERENLLDQEIKKYPFIFLSNSNIGCRQSFVALMSWCGQRRRTLMVTTPSFSESLKTSLEGSTMRTQCSKSAFESLRQLKELYLLRLLAPRCQVQVRQVARVSTKARPNPKYDLRPLRDLQL